MDNPAQILIGITPKEMQPMIHAWEEIMVVVFIKRNMQSSLSKAISTRGDGKGQIFPQPRSQGLRSYRPLNHSRRQNERPWERG